MQQPTQQDLRMINLNPNSRLNSILCQISDVQLRYRYCYRKTMILPLQMARRMLKSHVFIFFNIN